MKMPTPYSDFTYSIQIESWPIFLTSLSILLVGLYGCYRVLRKSKPTA